VLRVLVLDAKTQHKSRHTQGGLTVIGLGGDCFFSRKYFTLFFDQEPEKMRSEEAGTVFLHFTRTWSL
jgi:hypothetical protein